MRYMSFKTEKNEMIVMMLRCGQTVVDILIDCMYNGVSRSMCRVRNLPTGKKMVRLRTTTKVLNCAQTTETCVALADEAHLKCMEHGKGSP
jgi:hypothetical protein